MTNTKKWLTTSTPSDVLVYLLLALPLIGMLLVTGLNFRLVGDEGFFHIRVIEQFASTPLVTSITDYPSASAPLPYLLWTIYGKVLGFDIWKLRLLTAVITYLTAVQFYGISKQHALPYPLLSTLMLVFMPYVFFHGYTIYTDSFGLFFGVLALRFYLNQGLKHWLLGALFVTCAIYSRQYYLTLPVGMLLYRVVANRHQLFLDLRRNPGHWLAAGLPILTVLPLFLLWGGMVPPDQQSDQFIYPVLQHTNFLFVFVGFYFLPTLISSQVFDTLRSKAVMCCVVLAILIPFYIIFRPIYDETFDTVSAATGLIPHGLDLVGGLLGKGVSETAQFAMWLAGIAIIFATIFKLPWEDVKYKLIALLVAFWALITWTPYVAERYYILIVPYLILLLYRDFRKWKLLIVWVIVQVILSVGFTYWEVALKSFDAW